MNDPRTSTQCSCNHRPTTSIVSRYSRVAALTDSGIPRRRELTSRAESRERFEPQTEFFKHVGRVGVSYCYGPPGGLSRKGVLTLPRLTVRPGPMRRFERR